MNAVTSCVIAIALIGSVVSGQQKLDAAPKTLAVCEVLADVDRYADQAIVIVGRMEHSVSFVDHYEYLSQDRCEHPVTTHGHVFQNRIQIWSEWETGMPKPPRDHVRLDRSVLAVKLRAIRKTTSLGTRAAVYGRLVKTPRLDEDCGVEGCGGDDVPLMIVAEPYNVHRVAEGGRLLPDR